MKKISFLIFVCACMLGCGGLYTANVENSQPDKISYTGMAYGLLPPPTPREMSKSKIDMAQAELVSAIAQNIKGSASPQSSSSKPTEDYSINVPESENEGNVAGNKKYGVIVNNSRRPIWWQHPEAPTKMKIEPDGFMFLPLSQKHESITIYKDNRDYRVYHLKNKTNRYAGLDTWFVVYVDKVY